jgi:hypothetical protein
MMIALFAPSELAAAGAGRVSDAFNPTASLIDVPAVNEFVAL